MPKRFSARLATSSEDAALRDILRRTPLPGSASVTLEREPSFFNGDVDAMHHDVAVMQDADAHIIAMGSRIERAAWVGGAESTVAYLGDLRVPPEHRALGGRILIEGFRFMRALDLERPVAATYTAIFQNNIPARKVLVGARAGLPDYVDRGRLLCPALLVRRKMREPRSSSCQFRSATETDVPQIVAFLNRRFRHRDLAPVHRVEDFLVTQRWPGLRPEHFVLACVNGKLVGSVAVWDLRDYRQIRVQSYNGVAGHFRGVLSCMMQALGWQGLPRRGEILPAAFASFFAVEDDDVGVGRLLLNQARYQAARRGIGQLFTCMHERDPLLPVLRGWPAIPSSGRLYEVVFSGAPRLSSPSLPHVEAALL